MNRAVDTTNVQATYKSSTTDFASISDRSYAPWYETATNENLDGCEGNTARLTPVDELLKIEHWKPVEPQFCKEIAAHYGQSRRSIQKWFVDLREIAPWFSDLELRLSDDRYTPLAVELLGHRYFAGSKKKWALVLRERFAERVETWNAAQSAPAIRPEVLPREDQRPFDGNGDRSISGDVNAYQRSAALDLLLKSRPKVNDAVAPRNMSTKMRHVGMRN